MKPTPRFRRRHQKRISAPPSKNFFLRDSRARTSLLALLLVIATVAVYIPVHSHPFATIDDSDYVNDTFLRDGLIGTASWVFVRAHAFNYQPLSWLLCALNMKLFGFDPASHHDEGIALHALTVVVLFWVLKRATGCPGRSFIAAALVALHPVNVESVAWIAARHTILSALFCYLALEAYRYYAARPSVARYATVAVLFILALMAKPQVIMLPVALLLWDYWPLRRMFSQSASSPDTRSIPAKSFWWLVAEKFPLFFICLIEAALTMLARGTFVPSASTGYQHYALSERLQYAIVSYVLYVRNAIWPSGLALFYGHPQTAPHWWYVAGAALLLLVTTLLAALFRRHRYLVVGWLWFLIMLVPMLGIVDEDSVQMMADRYAYVSFVGLFLMATWGFADWAAKRRFSRFVVPTVAAAILLATTAVTQRQIGYWGDMATLWLRSIDVTRGNWKAEYFAAWNLDYEGRHDEAITHYFRAAAINPADPYVNQAIVFYEHSHGNEALAEKYFKRILAWNVVHEPEDFDRGGKQFGVDRHSYYQHPELQP